jgi:hypothetical protein
MTDLLDLLGVPPRRGASAMTDLLDIPTCTLGAERLR